ncbi:MAG: RNA polymerase sigma factor RpoH [Alphaproteobacteria bacterium MarineAlpha5_Bin2]|jgi:RNA polymerase sigma-32 factor|nr:RNA polymerase sigma factor RpoH [Alphaproteobacteria bacterium]MEC7745247.1 RNA polymerase sigma factor RpoH [Pseudomonadota bacterium]PPR55498.1 MAG: RNA polymerase sigma factor RpoH [Alphaproteobacteria bacterium MarineAlpha5_Bin2]PPR57540.1 MAG: RNA polymerase sigma factor RpoH [Alphaproteobacteria bacterium MarineAlpha5_Bin3]HIA60173.1 RNA polymerase sigma factor RpoH [Pelagibacterales bacterium]
MHLPILSSEGSLSLYLQEIKRFPILTAEEEYMLAKRYKEHGDAEAAHKLVTSHLRLVAKIAMGYRGYGLPVTDLISEGNVGIMQAVKKFDPEKGFRLATYAMWWIRAQIQEYVLHSWSLVKIGTTAAQKKLFFNLRKLKNQLGSIDDGSLSPENVREIANRLNVKEAEVKDMEGRLFSGDQSLNVQIGHEANTEWQDMIVDDSEAQDKVFEKKDEYLHRKKLFNEALKILNPREKEIIKLRRLRDKPKKLEELSQQFNISRERVRQIEEKAIEKLQKEISNIT